MMASYNFSTHDGVVRVHCTILYDSVATTGDISIEAVRPRVLFVYTLFFAQH